MSKHSTLIEYEGYCYVKSLVSNSMNIFKMVEGTNADFAIKPFDVTEDMWLPVQLKVTKSIKSCSFRLKKNDYRDVILLLLSLVDKRIWVMPGSTAFGKEFIYIGRTPSLYSDYEIEDLASCLINAYHTSPKSSLSTINIPKCIHQQRELQYRRKREALLSLPYEYPEIEGQAHDFLVDGKKFQEKVMNRVKKGAVVPNRYKVWFTRSGKSYLIGDNEFYWLHVPDSNYFFIIPEIEMIKRNIVVDSISTKNQQNLVFDTETSHEWYVCYRFNYDDVDMDKINKLLYEPIQCVQDKEIPSLNQYKSIITSHQHKMIARCGHQVNKLNENGEIVTAYPSISIAAQCNTTSTKSIRRAIKLQQQFQGCRWVKAC